MNFARYRWLPTAQSTPPVLALSPLACDEVDVRVPMLSSMLRWPVTVSYFKKDSPAIDPPLYEVKSEIYNNGISRALLLDYNAFVLSGELTSLNIKNEKACH